jgi:hypothetical protein
MQLRNLILVFLPSLVLAAGPNVLSNTSHFVLDVPNAISILGGSSTTVDQTCPSGGAGYFPGSNCGTTNSFVPAEVFVTYATNGALSFYSANTASPVINHEPYGIITQSSTGYNLLTYDQNNYNTLETNSVLYMTAYCGGPGSGDAYPPVAVSTILPNYAPSLASNSCGYATGIEFSMSQNYKGLDTNSPSGTTASMAGLFQVLAQNHPTWTWGDRKAALRQTASNWTSGYVGFNASGPAFGFGNVNYDAANGLSSTANIYLQAPGMRILNYSYYASITIYPFVTTRRAKEVVYIGGTWPSASSINEMTATQIASAGGTKIFDDGGATGAQTFSYAPVVTGSATFTAITLDSLGNGSRVESYNMVMQSFTVGTSCLN